MGQMPDCYQLLKHSSHLQMLESSTFPDTLCPKSCQLLRLQPYMTSAVLQIMCYMEKSLGVEANKAHVGFRNMKQKLCR